ncbi:DUF6907 domain-containing protein [Streptomyces albicerus]|uniref:DUF6907 domain-containing protein n=1 Tax=Streptomyces albicerus TaxID=2569859 RepID=UPI00124B90EA|nr:hypothetical protein [Streptomyces albicerus]
MSNEDEQERAQRFVERHFPEVSRFLTRERADMPVYGPTDPFGDEEHTPDVIVRVDFLMSREQITTALGIAWAEIVEGDRTPESLSVVEVRHEVEAYLSVQAFHELDKQMERDRRRTWSPEQQAVMQLLAAAVDRAYPPVTAGEEKSPDLDSIPHSVQVPRYGDGTVTLQTVDRGEITADEPAWCVGHDGEQVVHQADIVHNGPAIAAEYEGVEFLKARIAWAPLGELAPEPYPVAAVDEFPPLDPDQLRELAAEIGAHAGRLYSLSNRLDRLRRAGA